MKTEIRIDARMNIDMNFVDIYEDNHLAPGEHCMPQCMRCEGRQTMMGIFAQAAFLSSCCHYHHHSHPFPPHHH
jgi:hypothetical protein